MRASGVALLAFLPAGLLACSNQTAVEAAPERGALVLQTDEGAAQTEPVTTVQADFKPFADLSKDVRATRSLPQPEEPVANEAPVQVSEAEETEPNNQAEQAQTLAMPFLVKAHMDPVEKGNKEGDSDWFVFEVSRTAPGLMSVELSALAGADLGLEVYREGLRGREVLISVNNAGAGKAERIPNLCLVNGRYWVHVFQKPLKKKKAPFSSAQALYELSVNGGELPAGQECEPNGEPLKALPVELPAKISGTLNRVDDEDLFVLDLTKLSPFAFFRIEVLPPMGAKMVLSILNRSGQEVFSLATSGGQKIVLPNLGLLPGFSEYFLSVKGAEENAALGNYTLTVTSDRLKERMELEPNASPELALRMPYDQPLQGFLVSDKDADLFKIEAPSDMPAEGQPTVIARPAIQFALTGVPGTDAVLELLSEDGLDVLQTYNSGGKGEGETIPNMPVPKAPLLLRVRSDAGANAQDPYTVQMTLVATEGMETEPNDKPEDADSLGATEEIRGLLPHLGDRDCFTVPAGLEGLVLQAPDNASLKIERILATGESQVAALGGGKSATLPAEAAAHVVCLSLEEGAKRASLKPYSLGTNPSAP